MIRVLSRADRPTLFVRSKAVRFAAGATATVLALSLAGCGSRIDPNTVGAVGAGQPGAAAGGVTNPDGSVVDPGTGIVDPGTGIVDPGTGAVDPGTSGGSGSGSGSGGGSGSGSGSGSGGGSGSGAVSGSKVASCDGFKNQTGITDKEIVIANASDISGPVPGLFEASQDALKAYVSYFNATSDICGRKLKLVTYDTRTDASADQQAYTKACTEAFAAVGSMSAFDSGGAPTAKACNLPDIRSAAVTDERNACSVCFGTQSTAPGLVPNSLANFIVKNYGSAAQRSAFFYINAGAAADNAPAQARAMSKRGMKFPVVQGIDISEFNYAPYVQKLKDNNIEVVFWQGAYQQSVKLRQAMEQNGYTPKLYMRDPTDYNPDYVNSGGSAVDGTVIYMNFLPFEEAQSNRQTSLYLSYLQQIRPGAAPTFFGAFSWSAAQLFVDKALGLGGKLSRTTMIAEIKKTAKYTNDGMLSPQDVGAKRTNECLRFIQLKAGKWVPIGGTKYSCMGLTQG